MRKRFFLSVIIIFTCVFYFGIADAQNSNPLKITTNPATVTETSASISGSYDALLGVSMIFIDYSENSGSYELQTSENQFNGGGYQISINNLKSDTKYYFRVCGYIKDRPTINGCTATRTFTTKQNSSSSGNTNPSNISSSSVSTSSSTSRGYYVGGKTKFLKAAEVSNLEDAGYICDVPGTSIEIRPVGRDQRTSFLVSTTAEKWTKQYNLRQGQWILALQKGSATINCQKCEGKKCVEESFDLPTITKYGTSR